MFSKLDEFRMGPPDIAELCCSKGGQIGLYCKLTFALMTSLVIFLHGHQIEVWDLSGPFVQGPLSWPVVCIVDFVVVERRGHALVELSAAKVVLAGVVAVVFGQIFVDHVELV
jgi:hypothetical protein